MGDYVDSEEYSPTEIITNLNEVLELKSNYQEKVVLLWGNHDLAYFFGGHHRHYCSGFRKSMLPELYSVFTSNRHQFTAAFQVQNYVWTHAGIVGKWFETYIKNEIQADDTNLADTLNRLFGLYYLPLFHVSAFRGGMYEYGGIFWADMTEIASNPLKGYHQVIGHSRTRAGIFTFTYEDPSTTVTCTDCLETAPEMYSLEIE